MTGRVRGILLGSASAALVWLGCTTIDPARLTQADTHRELASVKLKENRIGFAIREYQKALEINPRDPEAHFGIAEAYRRKGLFGEAEKHLLRTLELDPRNLEARLNLGVVYLMQERYAQAIEQNDLLMKDPTFLRPARALVNRGWARYKSGDAKGAESDFRRAIAAEPANYFGHLDLGIVLYERGEMVKSIQEFKRVLDLIVPRPDWAVGAAQAQARFRLAQAYVKLGRREKAVEQLEAASAQEGGGEWVRKSKEYLAVLE